MPTGILLRLRHAGEPLAGHSMSIYVTGKTAQRSSERWRRWPSSNPGPQPVMRLSGQRAQIAAIVAGRLAWNPPPPASTNGCRASIRTSSARMSGCARKAWPLEAYGQSQNRPMLHHIVLVSVEAGAFFKVHAQGPVAQQARVGDAIANGEGEAVGAKHIP